MAYFSALVCTNWGIRHVWLDKRHLVVDVPPDATLIYVGLPLLYSVSDWKGNVKFAAGVVAKVLDDERY